MKDKQFFSLSCRVEPPLKDGEEIAASNVNFSCIILCAFVHQNIGN